MRIGTVEGQQAFQGLERQDTFVVLDSNELSVTLYQTTDTLLRPSVQAFERLMSQPYWWSEETGLMFVLKPIATRNFSAVEELDVETAIGILEEMEKAIESV